MVHQWLCSHASSVQQHRSLYVDQGGGKRKGIRAVLLVRFFNASRIKKNVEFKTCSVLFGFLISSWKESARGDGSWSLFGLNEAPGLADCWGLEFEKLEFEKLYTQHESEKLTVTICVLKEGVSARKLRFEILNSQTETGTP
ncbi:hypothetical protein SADUNF_Sadunf02G0054500 [Salix dunnii]|uniref:Ribonucleotide reductase large subunit C-terminal domain-containing protein n=1 Tax=Salix dunnii TaxID=1413687 RepID=A0A835TFQ9_9ROSI|nr:hypothetical protein SADUNF_Sadunf02G0054500 [Salix dunnii]